MSSLTYYSTLGYYAVRVDRESGIYMSWEKYKQQIHEYPDNKNKLSVWTDGYCFNCKEINSKKQYLGKLNSIASVGIFFADDDDRNLSERLPGEIQTNNQAELYAVIRALEIVNKQQDIIINTDKRKGKTYFNHVKAHSGIYENEQADRLAYLVDDNSKSASESYIKEFILILQILETDKDDDTWFKENKKTNFRRPIIFPDNEKHITEYIQIKLNNKQNILLDKEHQEFLKQYKFVLDKDNNIIDEA
ncbi:18835_t:CDS:2, partial [Racocetra persica]